MANPFKPRNPRTKLQKGKGWAMATLVICGTFSIYANVRSGEFARDNVIVSAFPPVVAFLSSHLISYFNPKTFWTKATVYGGFGLVSLFAMYGSGWHIVEFVTRTGQNWTTAIAYIFMADAPMLLSAGILITRVSTSQTATEKAKPTQTTTPAKRIPAVKSTKPTITPTKRATSTKPAKPTFKAAVLDEMAETA